MKIDAYTWPELETSLVKSNQKRYQNWDNKTWKKVFIFSLTSDANGLDHCYHGMEILLKIFSIQHSTRSFNIIWKLLSLASTRVGFQSVSDYLEMLQWATPLTGSPHMCSVHWVFYIYFIKISFKTFRNGWRVGLKKHTSISGLGCHF